MRSARSLKQRVESSASWTDRVLRHGHIHQEELEIGAGAEEIEIRVLTHLGEVLVASVDGAAECGHGPVRLDRAVGGHVRMGAGGQSCEQGVGARRVVQGLGIEHRQRLA